MNQNFADALMGYIAALQKLIDQSYARDFPVLTPPRVAYSRGPKYVRIIKEDSQNSVHSFVEIETGNILKAKGWKGPTLRHPRSNIFDADSGMSGVNEYGANYL